MTDHSPNLHAQIAATLQPGDVCLFNRNSFFNLLIKIKTWSRFTHCEIATELPGPHGGLVMAASRNGQGCGLYALDSRGLDVILRPNTHASFDNTRALQWFLANRVHEQGYDYLGLINFTYARLVGADNGKMFCSEFATRFLRQGGLDPFPRGNADAIAPSQFWTAYCFDLVWLSDREDQARLAPATLLTP